MANPRPLQVPLGKRDLLARALFGRVDKKVNVAPCEPGRAAWIPARAGMTDVAKNGL